MKQLVHKRQQALSLRKKGYSYRDILKHVPVAKSTLSLWLKNTPLSPEEQQVLRSRIDTNISRGRVRAAAALHRLRLERDEQTHREAAMEFRSFEDIPFFHVGIALYWAEGSKRSASFGFTNSDPEMISVMVRWIETFLKLKRDEMRFRLYTHKPFVDNKAEDWWAKNIQVSRQNFSKTVYKPTQLLVKKRPEYMGCLRIESGKVKYLRKMRFWQEMLIAHHRA